MVDKIEDTGVNDTLLLTMSNVGNTCFLSSAIYLTISLFGYSKIPLFDLAHDCHLHVNAGHKT